MVEAEVLPGYLTAQRRDLLEFIVSFKNGYGYSPSNRDLMRDMGYGSVSTVHSHLAILRHQGYVSWEDGMPRTLRLTEAGTRALYS